MYGNGPLVIAGSARGQVLFYDARKEQPLIHAYKSTQTDNVSCLAGLGNQHLFAASEDQSIAHYDLTKQSEEEALELIMNPETDCRHIYPIALDRLCYHGSNHSVGIFELGNGERIWKWEYTGGVS